MPVGRKVPKEVQDVFDKYIKNNVRRLNKADALAMFETEFNLHGEQAEAIFEQFDQDKNGIMSIWEFQQFYMAAGDWYGHLLRSPSHTPNPQTISPCESLCEERTMRSCAAEVVKKFEELDADKSGKLDPEEAREGLKSMQTSTGRGFEDKEIDFFIKTNVGDDNLIDIGRFVQMLFRLKMYKPKK